MHELDHVLGLPLVALSKLPPGYGAPRHQIFLALDERVRTFQKVDPLLLFSLFALLHALEVNAGLAQLQVHLQLHLIEVLHHLVVLRVARLLKHHL